VHVAAAAGAADARARAAVEVGGNNSSNVSGAVPGGEFQLELVDAEDDVVFRTDRPYLWVSEDQTTGVAVRAPGGAYDEYQVCLSMVEPESETTRQIGCEQVSASNDLNVTSNLTWSPEDTGPHTLVASLVGTSDSGTQVLLRNSSRIHLVERTGDVDNDKLTNAKELETGTNLTDTDTDDDGLLDGAEVTEYGTDPLDADTDDDGVRDAVEIQQGTDPTVADTDTDGLADGEEIDGATDPTVADTDGDGLDDGRELDVGTDPTTADSDDDGLIDGYELRVGTDPSAVDSDGDWLADGFERRLGTDPAAAWSPAVFVAFAVGLLVTAGALLVRRRRDDPAGGRAEAEASTDADPGVDEDEADAPLTDRDRILQLLDEAGGQLKQTRIVEETDWSKAKVSRVLSSMEEDGDISKIRIGRENLICIKGSEPDLARGPTARWSPELNPCHSARPDTRDGPIPRRRTGSSADEGRSAVTGSGRAAGSRGPGCTGGTRGCSTARTPTRTPSRPRRARAGAGRARPVESSRCCSRAPRTGSA
jgi:uncharacterized membrane protein